MVLDCSCNDWLRDVRHSLPNAAAICQQYLSFRRQQQESIGNFLVRETLVHAGFVEAIITQRDWAFPRRLATSPSPRMKSPMMTGVAGGTAMWRRTRPMTRWTLRLLTKGTILRELKALFLLKALSITQSPSGSRFSTWIPGPGVSLHPCPYRGLPIKPRSGCCPP